MKRNPYLRVKLKSLADEAKTIRIEERKANAERDYLTQSRLREHRTGTVRRAARETLLAYQFLRGVPYEVVERPNSRCVNWKSVFAMVKKYGTGTEVDLQEWYQPRAEAA